MVDTVSKDTIDDDDCNLHNLNTVDIDDSSGSTVPPLIMRIMCLLACFGMVYLTVFYDKIDMLYGFTASGVLLVAAMAPLAFKKIALMIPELFTKIFGKK